MFFLFKTFINKKGIYTPISALPWRVQQINYLMYSNGIAYRVGLVVANRKRGS